MDRRLLKFAVLMLFLSLLFGASALSNVPYSPPHEGGRRSLGLKVLPGPPSPTSSPSGSTTNQQPPPA